ncbi:phenazine biosynthesis protein PhzF [Acidovorax sp. Leaf76]|uniref:PhzF family phenazine biosynthesis protein n=1 Tax=unclassified Acidovorax TaxID=2684926 RepID=UPI0006F2364B|nr:MULTISPECIES: PhzF family phenazine biosynthesis protein [unclassified Acidovorax]KQO13898.1 phenazine biosynthesis protein PhzF [Acidovorax sp. Leaf76]KQO31419.1 phenazine biosynthesis protein PhzF [Acidovorax sp. Leaf84]KQS27439.1 phenazine biosynthesis protein PhzF [Acidovorax sp. Leaf191]
MHQRPFKQIDVFSDQPGYGNPVAVVLDALDLSDSDMRRFAAWTNLSETTFLLPPTEAGRAAGADYRVRIFSPNGELPFAGHPTLGTCHAWLQAGHAPRVAGMVMQESALGLVRVEHSGSTLAFAAPPLTRSAPSPALVPLVASALGVRPQQIRGAQMLDNGPVWLGLLLDSAQTVLGLTPDHARLKDLGQDVGVIHVGPQASDTRQPGAVVRAFAAPMGNPEDPVTGTLNASLAEWLIADGLAPRSYLVAQGECLGRAGRVNIRQDDAGQIWVGGQAVTCIEGTVLL